MGPKEAQLSARGALLGEDGLEQPDERIAASGNILVVDGRYRFACYCVSAVSLALLPAAGNSTVAQITNFERGDIVLDYEVLVDSHELAFPVYGTHAGDGSGRLFLVDRPGAIRVLEDDVLSPTPFLDISAETLDSGPRGMLGMAFHPGFADDDSLGNGKLYTFHTVNPSGTADFPSDPLSHQSLITEWRVDTSDPNRVDPASRREILRIDHHAMQHSGGMLAFDDTERLYIAVGDPFRTQGQNLTSPQGSILRIDPLDPALTPESSDPPSANGKYRIPSDNPFADSQSRIQEIFAFGFRNPWRLSFDRDTGLLFGGDVGEGSREEVDVVVAGGNYGWSIYEGTREARDPPPGLEFVPPLAEYSHAAGRSVTGGYVYRGSEIPWLEGMYVFGDLTKNLIGAYMPPGTLLYLNPYNVTGAVRDSEDVDVREITFLGGKSMDQILVGFAEDELGELYMIGTNGSRGQVRRLIAGPAPLAGDFNGNGLVEQGDLDLVLGHWGADGTELPEEWINDLPDGVIDQGELDSVLTGWGSSYPSLAAHVTPEPPTIGILVFAATWLSAFRLRGLRSA